ncbi:hypothetical protein [uncultured Sphaerochaeta sp.]|uniref:hypothetical protein n=1 Tax=uncultured Sphaerochaeta sp. TaxID=886478 RepID=UPI002A0A9AFE|nr:hypothetical protein [uncultured Sphaerochaeta sp.]
MNDTLILRNNHLLVELAKPGKVYGGSRFDRGGFIKQITLDNTHTFLGKEQTKNGLGTKGLGMIHGWLWKEAGFLGQAEYMPVIGVGTLHNPTKKPYDLKESYEVEQAMHTVLAQDSQYVSITSHQVFSDYLNLEIERSFSLEENQVTITSTIRNLGTMHLKAEEYNHNFLCFDEQYIDSTYKVSANSEPMDISIVRGEVISGMNYYRPLFFEENLGTLALTFDCRHYANESVLTIENEKTHTRMILTDSFRPSRTYHWISPWCLCPETFKNINLKSGETETFTRSISVQMM